MSEEESKEKCCKPGADSPKEKEAESCCDPNAIMEMCPCCSFMKKHCGCAVVLFLLLIVAFLISQVGGIMGIIAFFRTL